MSLFLCLSGVSLGQSCQKRGKGCSEKKMKSGNGHIGGLSVEWRVQTFSAQWFCEIFLRIPFLQNTSGRLLLNA